MTIWIKRNDMTYKELLDSVSFEEIVPYIEKYHGEKGCLALVRISDGLSQSELS